MAMLARASIMDGTDNNHGMSDQIISIIQMQPAWVTVIMEQITLDTPLTLQDIIKVIMDAQISTMTIRTATFPKGTEVVVGVEADMVAEVAMRIPMVAMKPSHSSTRSMAQVNSRIVIFQRVQRLMRPLKRLQTSMSLVERYARGLQPRTILQRKPSKTRMRSKSQELLPLKKVTRLKHPQMSFRKKLQSPKKRAIRQCQFRHLKI
jgi:hypothetical protein